MIFFLLALGLIQPASPTDLQQGLIALRDGKLADARTSLEKAVSQDPKNAFAWVSLAETCRRMANDSCANEAARKAEQFGGGVAAVNHALASFYSEEGQYGRAAALEEKYSSSPKADPTASMRTAELYTRAGDPANAERVLKAAWENRRTDAAVAFSYAQVLLHKLDFAGAENAVSPAIAAHPKDPQLILVLGVARYGERRFSDAINSFLQVIAIDPAIPQPYEFIGKMLEQAGPALPEITRALEARVRSAPDDAMANRVLAMTKLAADAKDVSAEALLRHSISLDDNQWESHYQLGVLLESRHDFTHAAEELKRAVGLQPREPMPHYHLARVYDRLGDSEAAQAERRLHAELSRSDQ